MTRTRCIVIEMLDYITKGFQAVDTAYIKNCVEAFHCFLRVNRNLTDLGERPDGRSIEPYPNNEIFPAVFRFEPRPIIIVLVHMFQGSPCQDDHVPSMGLARFVVIPYECLLFFGLHHPAIM